MSNERKGQRRKMTGYCVFCQHPSALMASNKNSDRNRTEKLIGEQSRLRYELQNDTI